MSNIVKEPIEEARSQPKNETRGCTVLWNDNKEHPFGGNEYAWVVLPNGKSMAVKILSGPGA